MDLNSDEWRSKLNYVRRKWHVKEDVVISGMSGRFPKSENIQEFTQNLFSGIDMTSSGNDRFPAGVHGFPTNCGKVENLQNFDAEFFKIPEKHANYMDPQLRKLLEVAFEALVDAGIDVKSLNGSNTGFYYGSSFQETDMAFGEDPHNVPQYQQNHMTTISQIFGLKGPIGHFDTACGSSFSALNEAYTALKSGLCDRAIVAGFNICLVPVVTLQFRDLQMVSSTGKSKSLDESADGYGRSEAVCCIVLQLKPEAKRIYSTIVNCRSNTDGYKEQGISFPSVFLQRQLMAETYDEAGLDPTTVEYVEAHTTGTQVGDPVELKAIYDVFCYQRSAENPVKIGCLKSNMGHSEAASGLCAMIKANIVFQCGYIPPNIHFNKPNPRIEGLMNGKMVPIIEKIPFNGDYISLNCFGFGGANAHVILKGNKARGPPESFNIVTQIPRLVPICGRTPKSVQKIQKFLRDNQSSLTNEFFDLLYQFSKTASMPHKGYTLISQKDQDNLFFHDYTLESQWHDFSNVTVILPSHQIKFDRTFRHVTIFSNTLDRLSKHAEIHGINLSQLLFGESNASSISERTVATVASQLVLINLMRDMKVPINGFIGSSLGQLAYAFAKNLITEDRAINAAYWLGHFIDHEGFSSKQVDIVNNTGIQKKNSDIDANYNEIDWSKNDYHNISGSIIRMKLNGYLLNLGRETVSKSSTVCDLLTFIDNYSRKMKTTESINGIKSSPMNVKNSIFEQITLKLYSQVVDRLPPDSILIDLDATRDKVPSYHLRRVQFMESDILTVDKLLDSIGRLYAMHLPIDVGCLYPPINYPVPIDTCSLNSLITFDHSKEHEVFKYPEYFNHFSPKSSFTFKVTLSNAEDWFYSDHKIDGRTLFPATGMVMYAWQVASQFHHVNVRQGKFLLRDVSFIRATVLADKEVRFKVNYMPYSGSFMITESDAPIAMGKVFLVDKIEEAKSNYMLNDYEKDANCNQDDSLQLSRDDIYKELRNRGYDYGPSFRCLAKADQYGRRGSVEWKEVSSLALKSGSILEKTHDSDFIFLKTWVTFSDSVLQLALLSNRCNRSLFVPTGIETMLIDAEKITQNISSLKEANFRRENKAKEESSQDGSNERKDDDSSQNSSVESSKTTKTTENRILVDVLHDPVTRTLVSDGLWMRGLKASLASRRSQKVLIETQDFIPFNEEDILDNQRREQLNKYHEVCKKYAASVRAKIISGIKPSMKQEELEALRRDFPYENNPQFALLECLMAFLDQNADEVDISKIDQDILVGKELQFSFIARFLKPFVTIALNSHTYCGQLNPSLTIIEYNDGKNFYLETMKSSIDAQSMGTAKVTYTIATSKQNSDIKDSLSGRAPLITWDAESPLDGAVARADLLIYKNHSGDISSIRAKIEHLTQAIKPGGFLLTVFREGIIDGVEKARSIARLEAVVTDIKACCLKAESVISLMEEMNWTCVSRRLLEKNLLPIRGLLFKRKSDTINEPKIIHISPLDFSWVEKLNTLLKEGEKNTPICLVGDSKCDQSVVGFTKSLGLESSGDRIICIANRYHDRGINLKDIDMKNPHFRQVLEKGLKFNIYDPIEGWGEYNHIEVEEKREKDPRCLTETFNNVSLKILQPGDLSSLKWCESSVTGSSTSSTRSVVNVCYSSLNFKDVLFSTARLPLVFEPSARKIKPNGLSVGIGLEYSGYDDNGNRIMGMTPSGAMATQVSVEPTDFVWPVPEDWSLEDAATVPVVYGTAIYGLIMRGNLKRGESVLIHAGSGGVGIAAIHLCLSYDCTVYTTVGTPEKRQFILDRFPQLTEDNIGNSRDTSFEEMILRETGGRGVDIVLNSLADDKLQASLRCLASGGRFLEIGKYDGFKNSPVDLGWLDNGKSFHGVMLDAFFDITEEQLSTVSGEKKRLECLLEEFLKNGAIRPLPRTVFEMDRAEDAFRYMAAGKHIGKVVIKIRDSTRDNQLGSISALKAIKFFPDKAYIIVGGFGGFGLEIALWMAFNGAKNIVINSRNGPQTSYHHFCLDRMIENNVQVVISNHNLTTDSGSRELFNSLVVPVGGIFNSALVLSDALFADQTSETFTKVCASKVNITHNLDRISREMCPSLDYFVVFSSIVSGRGNVGQTNYGLANSFMESVCERRRRDGLHGLAIQWGLIGDVGFVVEKMGADIESIRGTAAQRIHSCLSVLERVLNYPNHTTTSMIRSEDKKLMAESSGDIIKSISHILGIKDIYALDPKITLGELGMDSLMAIEVQQALERNFNVSITAKEIRQLKICDLIVLSKKFSSDEKVATAHSSSKSQLESTSDLKSDSLVLPEEPMTTLNDRTGEILFVLPPIEGHYQPFSGLFERLDQPVVGLNWTYDLAQLTTIEEAAGKFVERISSLTNNTSINMIGYSFGGVVALSIAKLLEERKSGPKVEKLVLFDADPGYLKKAALNFVSSQASSDLESVQEQEFIKGCLKRYVVDTSQLDEDLKQATSRAERFNVAKKFIILQGVEPSHAETIMKINELTLQKGRLISIYEPEAPRNCKIIHLRAKEDLPMLQNIDKDTKMGEQHFFEGNHNNFISKNLEEISAKVEEFFCR
ncbi:fatty acid synthase-like [Brevipalpus obovatus]|uniref:fatty acid synthase-like n=1 Tax=Brevipalpus obovatus TaxID=246614 RepID=UPI003D9E048C